MILVSVQKVMKFPRVKGGIRCPGSSRDEHSLKNNQLHQSDILQCDTGLSMKESDIQDDQRSLCGDHHKSNRRNRWKDTSSNLRCC